MEPRSVIDLNVSLEAISQDDVALEPTSSEEYSEESGFPITEIGNYETGWTAETVALHFEYQQQLVNYAHNSYKGFIIVWSIVFSILILSMFYKLLTCFGR